MTHVSSTIQLYICLDRSDKRIFATILKVSHKDMCVVCCPYSVYADKMLDNVYTGKMPNCVYTQSMGSVVRICTDTCVVVCMMRAGG